MPCASWIWPLLHTDRFFAGFQGIGKPALQIKFPKPGPDSPVACCPDLFAAISALGWPALEGPTGRSQKRVTSFEEVCLNDADGTAENAGLSGDGSRSLENLFSTMFHDFEKAAAPMDSWLDKWVEAPYYTNRLINHLV